MKIVIMGTGPFAVPSCRKIVQAGHQIPLVVVRPPVVTNAKKIPLAPVQAWGDEMGLPLFQPASINDSESLNRLREVGADLFFVCDYGQILSKACLEQARLGGINLHGSLLPRHRGAAPVQWTLLSGDAQAGVSVIHMTPGLDAGPVVAVRSTEVLPDENAADLEERLSQLGADATIEAITLLSTWDGKTVLGRTQDPLAVTKAPRLHKRDGRLNFGLSAMELARQIRGYQPWPGAYGDLVFPSGKQLSLHLRAARAVPAMGTDRNVGDAWTARAHDLSLTGTEWSAPWDQLLVVQTGAGWLLVSHVQPAGKRIMAVAEFLRGHPLPSSDAHFVS